MINITNANLQTLPEILGYSFIDEQLLTQALTHCSCALIAKQHNQRLEFFGDAILGMIISEHLYELCPNATEGTLTEIKSVIVSRRTLAQTMHRLNLREFIRLERSVAKRAELPASIYANVFEAIIAAIYLDGGYASAKKITLNLLRDDIEKSLQTPRQENYKSQLQEWAQSEQNGEIVYRLLEQTGLPHARIFTIGVYCNEQLLGTGVGDNKKIAEQHAAKNALANSSIER